jgi:hypothetical protein
MFCVAIVSTLLLFVALVVFCGPTPEVQDVEVTRVVPQPMAVIQTVEVTRVVEVDRSVEVTRVVDHPYPVYVNTYYTPTPPTEGRG